MREEAKDDVGSSLLCVRGNTCGGEDWELVGLFAECPAREEMGQLIHQGLPGRKIWIWKPAEGRIFWEEAVLGNVKLFEKLFDGAREVRVRFALWRKSFVWRHGELGWVRDRNGGRSGTKKGLLINDGEACISRRDSVL